MDSLDLLSVQVFKQDIERLLSMEEMWRHRTKPTPLDYDNLEKAPSSSNGASTQSGIKDQRALSVKDSFDLFIDR
jgi:ubiquitin-like 1-activating enzyme E1 B